MQLRFAIRGGYCGTMLVHFLMMTSGASAPLATLGSARLRGMHACNAHAAGVILHSVGGYALAGT